MLFPFSIFNTGCKNIADKRICKNQSCSSLRSRTSLSFSGELPPITCLVRGLAEINIREPGSRSKISEFFDRLGAATVWPQPVKAPHNGSAASMLCNLRRMPIVTVPSWFIVDILDDHHNHQPNQDCQAQRSHHYEESTNFPNHS